MLPPEKWSVPFMKTLAPGTPGITLALNEEHADKLWRALKHQPCPMAMIAPKQVTTIPRRLQHEVLFDVIEKAQERQTHDQQSILRGVLIQLGSVPVVPAQVIQPLSIAHDGPSTVVVGLDLLHQHLPADLRAAVQGGRFKRELQEQLEQMHGGTIHLDVFRQQSHDHHTHALVRLPTGLQDRIIMASGEKGLFWSPIGASKQHYSLVWIKGDVATDYDEARRLAQEKGVALALRDGKFALRARDGAGDQLRKAMGLTPGRQYTLVTFPVHVSPEDVEQVIQAMAWKATLLPHR